VVLLRPSHSAPPESLRSAKKVALALGRVHLMSCVGWRCQSRQQSGNGESSDLWLDTVCDTFPENGPGLSLDLDLIVTLTHWRLSQKIGKGLSANTGRLCSRE